MDPTLDELIERHEQLLKLDETLTEHEKTQHFDMRKWGMETHCGTVHCLAGHAASQPYFQARGLCLVKDPDWDDITFVTFGELERDSACEAFFGEDAYDEMFDESYHSDWAKAMDRVRARLDRLKAQKAA